MIKDYISAINTLSTMRLCSNVPGQSIIIDAINDISETEKLLKKSGDYIDKENTFIIDLILLMVLV